MAIGLLGMAIELCKSGDKDTARELLQVIALEDPHNESAWMWYAETFPTAEERIQILEKFLLQNKDNQRVQALYDSLLKMGINIDQPICETAREKTIKCQYCGKQMSDSLPLCPYCGAIDSQPLPFIQTIQRDNIPVSLPQSPIVSPEDEQIDISYQSAPNLETDGITELSINFNEPGSLTQPDLFSQDSSPDLPLEDDSPSPTRSPKIEVEYVQPDLFQATKPSNQREHTFESSTKSIDARTIKQASHDTNTNLVGYTDPDISPIYPTDAVNRTKSSSSTRSPQIKHPSALRTQIPGARNEGVISYSQKLSTLPPDLDRITRPQGKLPQTNSNNKQSDVKTDPGKESKGLQCPNCQSYQVEDTYEVKWRKVLLNSLLVIVTVGIWVFALVGVSILNRKPKTRYYCSSCRYGWE